MQFHIEEIRVFWPFPYIYPEQFMFMRHLKHLLDKHSLDSSGLLEMPCGCGKTMSVLALVVSYQLHYGDGMGKLFYLSRTVPEMEAVLAELRRLLRFVRLSLSSSTDSVVAARARSFLGVGLSSRAQLCVHPEVSSCGERPDVDAGCRALQPEWGGQGCAWKQGTTGTEGAEEQTEGGGGGEEQEQGGVASMAELRARAAKEGFCAYYAARAMLARARVIVFSYQYVLHAKILEVVTKPHIVPRSIAVFDEAHNIDQVCIESMTIRLGRPSLEDGAALASQLEQRVAEQGEATRARLAEEYRRLVDGLRGGNAAPGTGGAGAAEPEDGALVPQLEQLPIPGALRKAGPFLRLLGRLCEYLLLQLAVSTTAVERPGSFLRRLAADLSLPDTAALAFTATRLASLLRALQIPGGRESTALRSVAEMLALLALHSSSNAFAVLRHAPNEIPRAQQRLGWDDGMIQLACLDASLAMPKNLFGTIAIVSATLSPLHMFPRLLALRPSLLEVLPSSNVRKCVLPLVVCKGGDQALLNTKFLSRSEPGTHRNYAQLLLSLAQVVPDGMIVFFPSYGFLETCVAAWHASGSLQALLQHKLVFVETRDARETAIALANFQQACDVGRGALLLCVARGKVSEGVDFAHHHGRCVVVIGLPYQYTKAPALKQRLDYMRTTYGIAPRDYLTFDAVRHAAQCAGRVIRSKSDYAVMVFADSRYALADKRDKLPAWIRQDMRSEYSSLDTDVAAALVRRFTREMAQPWDISTKIGQELWDESHIPK